ncbi:hypothetical protein [Robertkochia flava]|uniref:hypothetical protein n=1 Tax=Robertkochia flava TaxID=3447986 RepID=UPI001CCDB85B|nr:hypothetical protein [Robertkochia marina]
MKEKADGSRQFKKVIRYPGMIISNKANIALANDLHKQAGSICLMANSCNFPVEHHPKTQCKSPLHHRR